MTLPLIFIGCGIAFWMYLSIRLSRQVDNLKEEIRTLERILDEHGIYKD